MSLVHPDPLQRAPRYMRSDGGRDVLRLAPPALQGALLAVLSRDTRALPLDDAQRLSHFPASPMVTISWMSGLEVGLVAADGWQAFGARVMVAGSQSRPNVSWAPSTGVGQVACFNADAAQALFGLDLAAIQDRFVPVEQAIDAQFAPLWEALTADHELDCLSVLEQHLGPRWQALQGRAGGQVSLRQLGRHWVARLAFQAHAWRSQHSPRHVERRVKAFSGRSLRQWESLVRTEGLFFAARERHEAGQPLEWAALAQDEGFADQAHMSRVVKRITGFSPTEFAQRFIEDESFWMYRLWV
jgi:AraC-like DNA-binding protein